MHLFFWNPDPIAFRVPYLDHPVRWYGVLFALGFFLAYFILERLLASRLEKKSDARPLVDALLWYVVIATLVGARLGHVLFYDFGYYWNHPLDIFKVWEGGLASHGGAIGIILALTLYYHRFKERLPAKSFWGFVDLFVIPVPLVAAMIRLGNFMNQEIVGTESTAPFAVVFQNPAELVSIVPRHPVQLYEAGAYLALFVLLWSILKWRKTSAEGVVAGLFFSLLFSARIVLEFFKVRQFGAELPLGLDMGQWLSLPFVFLGLYLIVRPQLKFNRT